MKVQASPLLAAFALLLISLSPAPVEEKALSRPRVQSASDVFAIINDYRAQNGLPAYAFNSTLASIARFQSDYLSQIVQTNDVHAGPGGTRPRDRAYAVGYGSGEQFWITEIGVYGMGMTPEEAVNWWKGSPDHNPWMISDRYKEMGCGVSQGQDDRNYYICDIAYVAGGPYVSSNPTSLEPATSLIIPVSKATPRPDGSLVHIVLTGQSLWNIAALYDVSIEELQTLNGIANPSFIAIGQEITVAPPGSYPTVTPTAIQETSTPTATETKEATIQSSPTTTLLPTELVATPTARPTDRPLVQSDPVALQAASKQNSTVKMVVGVSLAGIAIVFAASFFIQKPRPPEPPEDNDPFAPIE